MNPCLWQDLALARATVLETRAKLMIGGGKFDTGDDLIRKAIFIRTSICGDNHPETISTQEALTKETFALFFFHFFLFFIFFVKRPHYTNRIILIDIFLFELLV